MMNNLLKGCRNLSLSKIPTGAGSSSRLLRSQSLVAPTTATRFWNSSFPPRTLSTVAKTDNPQTTDETAPVPLSPTPTNPRLLSKGDRKFALFDSTIYPKLKPSIVKRRLDKCLTYVGVQRDIRYSPWRLNRVCQLVAGLPVQEALTQLEFCFNKGAPIVKQRIQKTVNLADIRDGLQPSQLEVAECFATHGRHLKRMKTIARGRMGKMKRRHSHMRLVLREIDFPLKLVQARTMGQKRKWFQLQMQAQEDADKANAERRELERLEKESEQKKAEKEAKK